MSKISIIIPVYNIEKYISKCLDSVLAQTYKDIEVIVVDDGSKDKSAKICDEYAACDSRVIVIHKENGGLSSARNAGIAAATGDYIMTVDGDDFINEDMCSMLYDSITSECSDMAVCGINNITESGEPIYELNNENPLSHNTMTKEEYQQALLHKGNWYFIVAWNKLYKKEVFNNVCYPKGKIHEDEYVIHRILNNCSTISCIPDGLYNYVRHKGSITNSGYSVKRLEVLSALFDRSRFYMETGADSAVIAANTVAAIKILYQSYKNADVKNEDFKKRYKEIHKALKNLIKEVLRYKMRLTYRVFLLVNLISPYITYKFIGRYIKK